ncbi:hypothetical protein Sjap_020819 [Stephania japonica]|uniref:DUF4408 domain-containing protein n=1 Tax=Stephania japonica TaxID=461633 RepID=A0AAP0F437_9MAGN
MRANWGIEIKSFFQILIALLELGNGFQDAALLMNWTSNLIDKAPMPSPILVFLLCNVILVVVILGRSRPTVGDQDYLYWTHSMVVPQGEGLEEEEVEEMEDKDGDCEGYNQDDEDNDNNENDDWIWEESEDDEGEEVGDEDLNRSDDSNDCFQNDDENQREEDEGGGEDLSGSESGVHGNGCEEDESSGENLTRRIEEFIEKVNSTWREELLKEGGIKREKMLKRTQELNNMMKYA